MNDWSTSIGAALAGYTLSAPVRAANLVSLSENATYVVDLADGSTVVARLHRPGFRSPQEIRSELAWITALRRDDVVPTPEIIPDSAGFDRHEFTVQGQRRYSVLFEYIEGRSPTIGDDAALIDSFTTIGGISRKLHDHVRTWHPPEGFTRVTWSPEYILGVENPSWEPWRLNPEVTPEIAESLGAVETHALATMRRYRMRHPDRFGLIHTDLRTANLLVHEGRTTVIDFDDCGFGFPMWDLAGALSFIEAEPIVPQLVAAWIRGYGGVDADDLATIPALIILRRLQLVGWMNTRQGTPEHEQMVGVYVRETERIGAEFLRGIFALDPTSGGRRPAVI